MPDRPEIHTHASIDRGLCGEPVALGPGRAEVVLTPTAAMVADAHGLVHGGFVFGLADHAAMLAVNEPTVVLAKAESRFLAPVRAGERLVALARVESRLEEERARGGRPDRPVVRGRPIVQVTVEGPDGRAVFAGTFHCAVPARHVLDTAQGEPGGGER
jgi:acyl-coenzyme A thioesterase PaaI-like protein